MLRAGLARPLPNERRAIAESSADLSDTASLVRQPDPRRTRFFGASPIAPYAQLMGQAEFGDLCEAVGVREGAWEVGWDGGWALNLHHFELLPDDFLQQAEVDLAQKTQGGDQNAIANAKRAIFCQIDRTLVVLGYEPLRWRNDRRMETIAALGFVAPRILAKVNSARNLLEHSYRRAERIDAEDAVDVAALFTDSAATALRAFPTEFFMGFGGDEQTYERGIRFRLSINGPKLIRLAAFGVGDHREVTLSAEDRSFPRVVALGLASYRGTRVDAALASLLASL